MRHTISRAFWAAVIIVSLYLLLAAAGTAHGSTPRPVKPLAHPFYLDLQPRLLKVKPIHRHIPKPHLRGVWPKP